MNVFPFRDTFQRPTSWYVFTSSGESAAVGYVVEVGMLHADFYLTQTPTIARVEPGPGGGNYANVTRLRFVGAGAGLGTGLAPIPIDLSASDVNMYSDGRIYCGPSLKGSDVKIEELRGWCNAEVYSASLFGGDSCTLLYFGVGPSRFLPEAKAIGVIFGIQIGLPGVSAVQYIGRIR